jgi:cytochrome c556
MFKSNYIIILAFSAIILLPSCWGWEEAQEETRKVITQEEEEASYTLQEGENEKGHEELKGIMAAASKHMKRLNNALVEEEWASARDSAKRLEELIGQRCVNSYIKINKDVPQDFVQISQGFNDAVLRFLVAERHQNNSLASSQFQIMQDRCQECHKKYRKEPSPGG